MTQQNSSLRAAHGRMNWRLAAAVAAVPLLAALPTRTARAQFPVQNGGHANDANNRIGSGGYNNSVSNGPTVSNNNIIYRNVTGGYGFRGALQETDPLSFRGNLPGSGLDRFTANSNAAAVRGTPSANTVTPTIQPFYGQSRFVTPDGFVPTLGNNGFVPAGSYQATTNVPNQMPNGTTGGSFQTGANLGTGATLNTNPVFENGTYAPYGLDTIRVGPLDAANQQTLLVVSPGFGIQQAPLDNSSAGYFGARTNTRGGLGADRFQHLSPEQLRQMQTELEQQDQTQSQQNRPNALDQTLNGPNGQPQRAPDQINRALPVPLENPSNQPINNSSLNGPLATAQTLGGQVQTGASLRRTLAGPAQQTPVYDELQDRLDRYRSRNPSAEEANVEFERARRARDNAAKNQPGTDTTAAPGTTPGAPATPGAARNPGATRAPGAAPGAPGAGRNPGLTGIAPGPATPGPATPGPAAPGAGADTSGMSALAGGTRTAPVHVTSLAAGVKAKGLGGLLKSAEDLMKQGKYTSAVEQYTLAEQVAPNNPLIPVGQAIAELGALSYRDAEQQLRRAFAGDPALLHAQYDLNAFLGEKRVSTLTADLKDLAAKEPNSEMPAFLLAFVNYNTGHEADAMNYLNDVEKREGRPDPIARRMRDHWSAPASSRTPTAPSSPAPATPGPALNK